MTNRPSAESTTAPDWPETLRGDIFTFILNECGYQLDAPKNQQLLELLRSYVPAVAAAKDEEIAQLQLDIKAVEFNSECYEAKVERLKKELVWQHAAAAQFERKMVAAETALADMKARRVVDSGAQQEEK